jgi:uncharacterized delta-60 repeat protein
MNRKHISLSFLGFLLLRVMAVQGFGFNAGGLDASFGAGGKVGTQFPQQTTTFRPRAGITAIAVQPDGKIVAAGYAHLSPNGVADAPAFALARYNTDGSLDTSFGDNGKLKTFFNGYEQVMAVALQPDGKIVAGGFTDIGGNNSAFALARYNANGSLDTSFGNGGRLVQDITGGNELVNGIAIQPDGRIIATGYCNGGISTDFATTRYFSDGTLDMSFGVGGVARTDFGGFDGAAEIILFADGRFVVAGSAFDGSTGVGDFALLGYDSNGNLDTAFGTGGKVRTDLGSSDNASDMYPAPDGKFVVSGYSGPSGAYDFAVARYNRDGSLDTTFDGDGKFTVDMTGVGRIDGANGVAVQSDLKIILVGRAQLGEDSPFDLAMARVNANGGLDSSFGSGGKVFTDFNSILPNSFQATNDEFSDVQFQADGKIVVGGEIEDMTRFEFNFAVARDNNDVSGPTPTSTPTSTPTATPSISGMVTYANSIGSPAQRFVSGVTVTGTGSSTVSTATLYPDGTYVLRGFGSGAYTITLSKGGATNGSITSFDAAKIAQHASGGTALTGNQFIAADVSGNGSVTSFDAGQIARYVAGVAGAGSTANWIFSPASRTYPSVSGNIAVENYSALLMGEVSGNWTNSAARPVDGMRGVAGDTAAKSVQVQLPGIAVPTQKAIIIPVTVKGAADKGIVAYEFDLRYDPKVLQPMSVPVDVSRTASRRLSAVTNPIEPGLLRVVIYGPAVINEDGVLVNLKFAAVGAACSITPLTFDRIIFNEGEPSVIVVDGSVALTAPPCDGAERSNIGLNDILIIPIARIR